MNLSQFKACYEMRRPSAIYKPDIFPDGDKWCALLGEDIQSGVCGFGDTPEKAAAEFDKAWHKSPTPQAQFNARKEP